MGESLVFLHLSDIHFRSALSGGLHDLDQDLRNEVERDAVRLHEELGPVTGILVTGDIAFAGLRDEFQIAGAWLRTLCQQLGCPEQNVWTVPGNHDLDRQQVRQGKILHNFRQEIRTVPGDQIDECLREWLGDVTTGPQLFSPLRNYIEFAGPFECDLGVERLSWHKDLLLNDGSTLRLLGLNSVLTSDEQDSDGDHRLVVGSAQCRLEREDGVEYLVMCHHPPQWLRDADSFADRVNSRSHIQLYGHKHRQRLEKVNESLRVFAGALHPDRKEMSWEPRFNYLTCAIEGTGSERTLMVAIWGRVWSESETRFHADLDETGEPVRRYAFAVEPWDPPQGLNPSAHAVTDRATPVLDVDPKGQGELRGGHMDATRRLAYRFLNLPYSKKVQVALKLGLLLDEDKGVEETELYRRFFHRARSRNMLAALWEEVESLYGAGDRASNPFDSEPTAKEKQRAP